MKVYINDGRFWKLLNEIDRTKDWPHWFRSNGSKSTDSYIYLLYNEDERMKVNIEVLYYTDEEDKLRHVVFWIRSTGLVLGTDIPKGSKTEDVVLGYLNKESDRIFNDVVTWRKGSR